jgi:F420-0:gamma-glutamyl ligase-like protein
LQVDAGLQLHVSTRRIKSKYWRPGDDFLKIIVDSITEFCEDGDIIVLSEKAVSVALGRVVDEAREHPRLLAKVLARIWMRYVWGYVLGPMCHFSTKTLWRLKRYPIREGEAHKEVALRHAGLRQALLHYSEGGIDVTNLPYAFASLPLENPEEIGEMVLGAVKKACGREVSVMIVDTDKTYSWNRLHLTSRRTAVRGVRALGLLALMLGRVFGWKARATPLTICGRKLSLEETLAIADAADRAMGYGAGRTVWDMARRFRVGLAEVSWEMLDRVRHYPIVLVRKIE